MNVNLLNPRVLGGVARLDRHTQNKEQLHNYQVNMHNLGLYA